MSGDMSSPVAPGGACPSEDLLASVHDGEADPAVAREVEAHADRCPACAAVRRRLEGLSGLLRAWEREGGGAAPPPGFADRVAAAVAPAAAGLRLEAARGRRAPWLLAAAAVACAALGAALARVATVEAPARAVGVPPLAGVAAAVPAPWADRAPAPAPAAARATPPFDATALDAATARVLASAPVGGEAPWREEGTAAAVARWAPFVEVQRRLGEPVAVLDGKALPLWAVDAHVRTRRLEAWIADRTRRLLEPDTRDPSRAGLALAPWLPGPDASGAMAFLRGAPSVSRPATPSQGGLTLRALARAAPFAAPPGSEEVLDLAEAVRRGAVRLLPDGRPDGEELTVEVLPGGPPVLVPAGELIQGGVADRVVAQGAWLLPGEEARTLRLLCRPVSRPVPRAPEAPLPTGWVAGPQVRALLARGEDSAAVLALADALVRDAALAGPEGEPSPGLLVLHLAPVASGGSVLARAEALLQELGGETRGFVATDPSGRFQGLECTDLPPAAARRHLVRSLAGYLAEARARSVSDPPRLGAHEEAVLVALAEHGVRADEVRGVGGVLLRGDDPRTGVVLDGLLWGVATPATLSALALRY